MKFRRRKKTVPIDDDVAHVLKEQRDAFVRKFGREPRPEDPLFFDPDSDTPRPIDYEKARDQAVEAMVTAGVNPRPIYAFHRTGLLVTEQNVERLTPQGRREWRAAIEEHDRLQPERH